MSPFSQPDSGRRHAPYLGNRPIASPHHNPVCKPCQLHQGIPVLGRGIKNIDVISQFLLNPNEHAQYFHGCPVVRARQLQYIHITGEKALCHTVSRKEIRIACPDVEQGSKGHDTGGNAAMCRWLHGTIWPDIPQFPHKPVLQGFTAQHPCNLRIPIFLFQLPSQAGQGGYHHILLQPFPFHGPVNPFLHMGKDLFLPAGIV